MFKSIKISLIAFIAAVGLSSVSVAAESESTSAFEGEIEIGALRVDTDHESAKFMEYRGIKGDSTYLVGNIDLSYENDGYYLDLIGKDLGIDTRNVHLDSGIYGRYNFFLEYDQTPHFISNNSRTVFDGAGHDNLTLPSGYVRTTPVSNIIAGIGGSGNLKYVDLEMDRKSGTAGFSLSEGPIDLNLSFKREEKEGTKSIGGVVGFNSVVLPEPVDYITDELRASMGYNVEAVQIELAYYLSLFNNEDESLRWQNPYSSGAANPVISLPSDNEYHKFTLSGGWNLPLYTRITVVGEYGKMTQDEDLLPYHADPIAPINGTEPRDSAEAEIETRLLNANLSTRPVQGLGVNVRYRHYETENNTPVDLFRYLPSDGETIAGVGAAGSVYSDGTSAVGLPCSPANPCFQQAALNTTRARYNQPYDYKQDLLKTDISYEILRGTTLSAGYDREVIHRDLREADETEENTYRGGIKTSISSYASAGGNYLTGQRRYDDYNGEVIMGSFTQDYRTWLSTLTTVVGPYPFNILNANPRTWVNHPDLRKFDVANRDRTQYSAFANLIPLDSVILGANYSYGNDDYPDTIIGLTESDSESYTVNATVTPAETVTIYTYYTNERLRSKQVGRDITTASITWPDATRDWSSTNRDSIDTVGVGFNVSFFGGRLNITPDYTYARTKTKIDIAAVTAAVLPLPDLKTVRHTFNLSGKYKVTDNWILGASYLYEKYEYDDWTTDNVTLDDTATLPSNVLILTEGEPDYEAHAGSITVAYKW